MMKPEQENALDALMGGGAPAESQAPAGEPAEEQTEAGDGQGASQLLASIKADLAKLETMIPRT